MEIILQLSHFCLIGALRRTKCIERELAIDTRIEKILQEADKEEEEEEEEEKDDEKEEEEEEDNNHL